MSARTYIPSALKTQFQVEAGKRRENWLYAVAALHQEVKHWVSEQPDWTVIESETEILEDGAKSAYTLPVLEITGPQGTVILEPIAALVSGAQGRVDLYGWPSLYRVMLLLQPNGRWVVRTDSGLDWPHNWSKDTFFELAKGLLRDS